MCYLVANWCQGLLPPGGSLDGRIKNGSLSYARTGCSGGLHGQCTSRCSNLLLKAFLEVKVTWSFVVTDSGGETRLGVTSTFS